MNIEIIKIPPQKTYAIRHQVMWPDKPLEFVFLQNDDDGLHFALCKGSNIISVVSLFTKNNSLQFRKFATKISEQGNGYGTLLLNHVMMIASKEKNIKKIWCNAREDKTSFYKKFSMTTTSKKFTKAGIRYVIMEKLFLD